MAINEGPSGFHSVYANVTEENLIRVKNPTNPSETILVPGPGAKVYVDQGRLFIYTEQGEEVKVGGVGATKEQMFADLKKAQNYGKGPTVFYEGSTFPPTKAVAMVRSYGGQGFDWVDVSSEDSWIGALSGLDKQPDMRWYTGELSERGYVGNGLVNPFGRTLTTQRDDFDETGASFVEGFVDVFSQAVELVFAMPEVVGLEVASMNTASLGNIQGHMMKNADIDPFTFVNDMTDAGAKARHHGFSNVGEYFSNVRRPWSSKEPFEGTVNEHVIGTDERMEPILTHLSQSFDQLKVSAEALELDAEQMRKLSEWDPRTWTDLSERKLGEYVKRAAPEFENLNNLFKSTATMINLDEQARKAHFNYMTPLATAMKFDLVPDISDDQHIVFPPNWDYEDQGHDVSGAALAYLHRIRQTFTGHAFDTDKNPPPQDQHFVPTWYVDDGKAQNYKTSVDQMAKAFIEDAMRRTEAADQLQYTYDTNSLGWLNTDVQNFVDILAPENEFRERYTIGENQNYRREYDNYQREMYEAFRTQESGWHHSKAEDMSKPDQFFYEKYLETNPDTNPTYVPQDYFSDKADTSVYEHLLEAEETIMAGERYEAPGEHGTVDSTPEEKPEGELENKSIT